MVQRRRSFQGPRRPTQWVGACAGLQVTAALPAVATIITEASFSLWPHPTLVRQRGQIQVYEQVGAAGTIDSCVALGLILVTAQALAAGVASLPKPSTEIDADWLWYSQSMIAENIASPGVNSGILNDRKEVDGKAMRKCDNNMVLVLVADVVDSGTASNIRVNAGFRLLLKT